ncbi:MAG: DUF2017 domain-containing protein, partial [uncultured Pseudonocardia sp.]
GRRPGAGAAAPGGAPGRPPAGRRLPGHDRDLAARRQGRRPGHRPRDAARRRGRGAAGPRPGRRLAAQHERPAAGPRRAARHQRGHRAPGRRRRRDRPPARRLLLAHRGAGVPRRRADRRPHRAAV